MGLFSKGGRAGRAPKGRHKDSKRPAKGFGGSPVGGPAGRRPPKINKNKGWF